MCVAGLGRAFGSRFMISAPHRRAEAMLAFVRSRSRSRSSSATAASRAQDAPAQRRFRVETFCEREEPDAAPVEIENDLDGV